MFIFVVNFSFVIQNVSFGIRGVIAKITLEILLSLVHMGSPLVDCKQMRFLESFATFFTTVGFIVFSGIIVFFVFVNTMSSEMHRGWQNFLTNFARYFQ